MDSSWEVSFFESDEDLEVDEAVEDDSVEDMLKSLTLQDKAAVAAKRDFSPTSEKPVITSIPEKDAECEPFAYGRIFARSHCPT